MSKPMTAEELQACREREAAATRGPWGFKLGALKAYVFSLDDGEDLGFSLQLQHWKDGRDVPSAENAAFIAHAREDVPRLLATVDAERETIAARDEEIARLRAEVAELRESANQACVNPADDCDCEGCRYAAEVNGRGAEEEEDGDD